MPRKPKSKLTKRTIKRAKVVIASLVLAATVLISGIVYDANTLSIGECVQLTAQDATPFAKQLISKIVSQEENGDYVINLVYTPNPDSIEDLQFLFGLLMAPKIIIRAKEVEHFKEVKCPDTSNAPAKPNAKSTSKSTNAVSLLDK